ncbi:transposase [Candidatus Dojkabacteria bacterium]|nr:transposase [Candidatus Dojkabacteria bacterium]
MPYELLLDKGYENYERRRRLKQLNCQVRMEMKRGKNRKRGPRFKFTQEDKVARGNIEKCFGWIKSFMILKCNRLRKKSLFMATFLFCLSFYAFMRVVEF